MIWSGRYILYNSLYVTYVALQEILLGEADIVLTGGTENMSQAPYAVRNVRWGSPLGVDLKVSMQGLPYVFVVHSNWASEVSQTQTGSVRKILCVGMWSKFDIIVTYAFDDPLHFHGIPFYS